MKAILKLVGILIGLVLVLFAALVFYVSTLDPNDYREFMADRFHEQTGRTLNIDGNIGLTIYPWLGIELNDVTISNAPDFGDAPFLQTEHALLRVKLMPLLREQYEIDTVRLHGAAINLAINEAGQNNWSDLMQLGDEPGRSADAGNLSLAAIVMGGVDIQDASFSWDDRSTGVRYLINNLAMSTGELVYGAPIELQLSLQASSNVPELNADVSLASTITYNLDEGIYDIAPLDLRTTLSGPNVPQNSTNISLSSNIRLDLGEETLAIRDLNFNALGTRMMGTVNVRNVRDPEPVINTNINVTGNDLAILFRVAEIEPLATQLATIPNRSFSFSAAIEADMDDGDIEIDQLQASLLGANLEGEIQARNTRSSAASFSGRVNASGPDLPTLMQVLGQIQGGTESPLADIGRQLNSIPDKSFSLNTRFDADMDDGDIEIEQLQASLLGASLEGEIQADNISSSSPSVTGRLNASGPDLPALMQLLGQVQGGAEAPLAIYGRQLRSLSDKSFTINTEFNADMDDGDVDIPVLTINALGINASGNLSAADMQRDNGNINGRLAVTGERMGRLLAALDQAELGEVLQALNLNVAVNGTRSDMNISPLDLKLVFGGEQIPNSPVNMALNASTRLNLERETLDINNFSIAGLGLNMSGKLNASNILDTPDFKGEVDIPAFSLRRLMRQLNQDLPETADSKVLEKLALSSTFEGSGQHMNISRLAMVLDQSTINGKLSVTDFDNPAIEFGLEVDQFNADRYLPPEADQSGPVTPETAAGAAAQLPLETLRSLNSRGEVRFGQLIVSRARLSDVVLGLNASGGLIKLAPVAANLYQGKYSGDVSLDATGDLPVLGFDSSLTGVQIDPFMMDFAGASNVSGTADMNMKVTARGTDSTSMISTMNGNGRIQLIDGVLQGIDVASVLEQVEIMIESKRPRQIVRGEQTPFETFSGTVNVNNGVVSSNDLSITAPGIKVTGRGTIINLNNNTINYGLVASADPTSATRGEERYNIGGYSIPIRCSGNANSPSCVPDVEEIIKVAVQREVQRQIGNVLQRALGVQTPPAAEPQQQQPTESAQPAEQSPAPAQQPADPTKEILNRALESIFNR